MQKRPTELSSQTHKINTGYGNLYVTVSTHESVPVEIFCTVGKSGASIMAKAEVVGRLCTLALKHGAPVKDIVEQLEGISGEQILPGNDPVKSIPDAVAKVLQKHYVEENE